MLVRYLMVFRSVNDFKLVEEEGKTPTTSKEALPLSISRHPTLRVRSPVSFTERPAKGVWPPLPPSQLSV